MEEGVDSNTPAGTPPPGVTANLDNPYTQYNLTIGFVVAGLTVTLPFIAVRIFTKVHVLRHVEREDCECGKTSLTIWVKRANVFIRSTYLCRGEYGGLYSTTERL